MGYMKNIRLQIIIVSIFTLIDIIVQNIDLPMNSLSQFSSPSSYVSSYTIHSQNTVAKLETKEGGKHNRIIRSYFKRRITTERDYIREPFGFELAVIYILIRSNNNVNYFYVTALRLMLNHYLITIAVFVVVLPLITFSVFCLIHYE